jgi:hypothetical protein
MSTGFELIEPLGEYGHFECGLEISELFVDSSESLQTAAPHKLGGTATDESEAVGVSLSQTPIKFCNRDERLSRTFIDVTNLPQVFNGILQQEVVVDTDTWEV